MDVRLFNDTPADAQAWDAYVAKHEGATSDHLWGWRRILSKAFGFRPYYLAAIDGGSVAGILPLFHIPRGFGRCALSSIPFGNYGGICADSQVSATALLDQAKGLLHRLKGTYLELRHKTGLPGHSLSPQSLYSRFVFPLTADPALHFQQVGSSNRNKIKKSARRGLRVVSSLDVDQLYPVHTDTARRQGSPCFPRRYFEGVVREFSGKVQIYVAIFEGRAVAYELYLFFKKCMVSQFSGSLSTVWRHYPNHLLFWHGVEQGCTLGFNEIDFCRSRRDSGSANFKRELRFVEEPLEYQYYLAAGREVPQRNPSNPKYQWIIRAWQRLPVAVTQLVGPSLVRYLA